MSLFNILSAALLVLILAACIVLASALHAANAAELAPATGALALPAL